MKSIGLLLAALLLLLPMTAGAQPRPTVAGDARHAFDLWLVAHNAADRALLEAFSARYGFAGDVQSDLDFRENVGRLDVLEIQKDTVTTLEALTISEWGSTLLVRIELAPDDSTDVTDMSFTSGMPTPPQFRPPPLAWEELVAETTRRLDALAAEDRISGGLLLACDGQPAFEWYGGRADREAGVPVTAATRFRMASLGKMFTAVSILQLVDAGRLSLDDPLSRHLPDYPDQAAAQAITIRQLLTHTAGLGNVFDDDFPKISASLKTHRDYWGAYVAQRPEFAPGAQDGYSNYGYILLGSVIEAVSGQSYYDYIEQHVFAPAGMTATGAEPETVDVPGRAHPYTKQDGAWVHETTLLPWRGTAAGGAYTTTHDLLKFADALEAGTLLPPPLLMAATSPQNHQAWYGYGFMVSGEGRHRQYGHEGGAPGMNGVFNVRPEQGCTVIGLGNFDPSMMGNVVNFVTRRLP